MLLRILRINKVTVLVSLQYMSGEKDETLYRRIDSSGANEIGGYIFPAIIDTAASSGAYVTYLYRYVCINVHTYRVLFPLLLGLLQGQTRSRRSPRTQLTTSSVVETLSAPSGTIGRPHTTDSRDSITPVAIESTPSSTPSAMEPSRSAGRVVEATENANQGLISPY